MKDTTTSAFLNNASPDSQDFSLVLGGPLFQLLRRAHLSDDAMLLVRNRLIDILF